MSAIDWEAIFPIASLSRTDLKEIGLSEDAIALFTDEDMGTLAGRLEDLYREHQFAIDLEIAANLLLDVRKQEEQAKGKPEP